MQKNKSKPKTGFARLIEIAGTKKWWLFASYELMYANGLYRRMWDEQQKVREWKFGEEMEMEPIMEAVLV